MKDTVRTPAPQEMTSQWLETAAHVGTQLAERAVSHDQSGEFVQANYDLLGEQGLFAMAIPAELGGGDASYADTAAVIRELARHCGSTALAFSMHTHPVALNVFKHLRGDAKSTAALTRIAANGLVIAGTGANDWLESSGEMQPVDGGFRVSARKHFVSGSPGAQVFVTSAVLKHDDGDEVLHFTVPFSSEGITQHDNWNTIGMRATGSNDISLDDVFVPEESIIVRRPVGQWHPMWNVIIPTAMPLIMSAYVGLADAAVKLGLAAAEKRPEQLAGAAGEMINSHTRATLALDDMVRRNGNHQFEPGNENTSDILVRKTLIAASVQETVGLASELVGGAAFFKGHPLERISRDIRACHFHPLPYRRQHQFSGRVALGLDPIPATS